MLIKNETHEPLAVRVRGLGLPAEENEELLELEPGEEDEVEDRFLEEIIIEHSSKPHIVVTMNINGN